jgi:xanthine dehydrogenase FAD-binding subunit
MVNTYHPKELEEALAIRAREKTILLAGGTDLMVKRKNWSGLLPEFQLPVLFLNEIEELKKINRKEQFLKVGAAITLSDLLREELIPEVLKEAIREMASPAIRNLATLGGNICNASPAGDTLPFLYATDATLVLKSLTGERKMSVDAFIHGPGKTAIREDEILTEVIIPINTFNKAYFKKVGTRKANAISKLSFVGLARVSEAKVEDIGICFGAVGPTIVRRKEIEAKIIGTGLSELAGLIPEIVRLYEPCIKPIDDQRSKAFYRKTVSLRILEFFLNTLNQ